MIYGERAPLNSLKIEKYNILYEFKSVKFELIAHMQSNGGNWITNYAVIYPQQSEVVVDYFK